MNDSITLAASGAMGRRLRHDRWHFQHGPIDLIIGIDGETGAAHAAIADAFACFATILPALVARLPLLRRRVDERADTGIDSDGSPGERTAARMIAACIPMSEVFVTPMAAVAGSVADTVLEPLQRTGIRRAFVNNGGDIALHLTAGSHWLFAVAGSFDAAVVRIDDHDAARGIATSGWRGRSFSLGIADAVTVIGRSAAQADVAATLIANAVDVASPAIVRQPAREREPDSDLGNLLVTTEVGRLDAGEIEMALAAGSRHAMALHRRGCVDAVRLELAGQRSLVGEGFGHGEGCRSGPATVTRSGFVTGGSDIPEPPFVPGPRAFAATLAAGRNEHQVDTVGRPG